MLQARIPFTKYINRLITNLKLFFYLYLSSSSFLSIKTVDNIKAKVLTFLSFNKVKQEGRTFREKEHKYVHLRLKAPT
jgi:hypothetical protein